MTNKQFTNVPLSNDERYKRQRLADVLPLDTPMSIDFHTTTFCNFKCIFCLHSSSNPCYENIKNKSLDFEIIKQCIDDMKLFPNKIKSLHFCGLGEPLAQPDIAKIIKYAKDANVAEKIDMNTNGSLFTKSKIDELINAKIDFIRISLNGLSSEDFMKYTKAKVDFDNYVENIKYLYKNRKETKVYIKILDFMVNTEEKKKFFYDTFESICDNLAIENYNECFIDTEGKVELKDSKRTQRGENYETVNCCPQPFFKLEILADGRVAPCSEAIPPITIGNIRTQSITDMWKSKQLNEFRLKTLKGTKTANKICESCTLINLCNFSSDNIDSDAKRLYECYSKIII